MVVITTKAVSFLQHEALGLLLLFYQKPLEVSADAVFSQILLFASGRLAV